MNKKIFFIEKEGLVSEDIVSTYPNLRENVDILQYHIREHGSLRIHHDEESIEIMGNSFSYGNDLMRKIEMFDEIYVIIVDDECWYHGFVKCIRGKNESTSGELEKFNIVFKALPKIYEENRGWVEKFRSENPILFSEYLTD